MPANNPKEEQKVQDTHIMNPKLSAKDKENIKKIHEMLDQKVYSKKHVEQVYVTYGSDLNDTLNMFLSGQVPKEEDDVQIVIEDTKKSKGEAKIDTT